MGPAATHLQRVIAEHLSWPPVGSLRRWEHRKYEEIVTSSLSFRQPARRVARADGARSPAPEVPGARLSARRPPSSAVPPAAVVAVPGAVAPLPLPAASVRAARVPARISTRELRQIPLPALAVP